VRVWLKPAGLHPVPQYWIEDRSGRLSRVDLAFPERKVAVEYEGEWRNGQLWALNHDRERLNHVHAAGWDVVFVTQPLLADPRKMIYTVDPASRPRGLVSGVVRAVSASAPPPPAERPAAGSPPAVPRDRRA
jgi:hypothetical protein